MTGAVGEWLRQGPAKPCTRVRFPPPPRAISSVGEHYLDTVGVTGSIPVSPTPKALVRSHFVADGQGFRHFHSRCPSERYAPAVRPLRYSINITLDGCGDHRAVTPDENLHRHATEMIARADALLFGRVTYQMME